MTGSVFVDTNVLVYRVDSTEPDKQARADEWLVSLWRDQRGRLSMQVVQEFYATVTRKLRPGLDPHRAREILDPYFSWAPVVTNRELVVLAWQIEERYQLSWWDSLIVAAAHQAGCRWLLTEDLSAGQQIGQVTVVDPFGSEPKQLEKL